MVGIARRCPVRLIRKVSGNENVNRRYSEKMLKRNRLGYRCESIFHVRLEKERVNGISLFLVGVVCYAIGCFLSVMFLGCEVPQSTWSVKDAVDDVVSEQKRECYFDGFDVICLVPGPRGEPGEAGKDAPLPKLERVKDGVLITAGGKSVKVKDGRDGESIVGESGRDGKDGAILVTRRYIISRPDQAPIETEITVELPALDHKEGSETDIPTVAEVETSVVDVLPTPPTRPSVAVVPTPPLTPSRVSCGGQTCHVQSRSDGYHVITEDVSGGVWDDGSWVLDEAGYQRWLDFLATL